MIKNYFKIAWRNLWKDKISSSINLTGLSVGMACCMLILVYVKDEFSFNKFNSNLDDIYRVNWTSDINGDITPMASTPVPLAPAMISDMPQVKSVARLYQRSGGMKVTGQTKISGKLFQEQNVHFADQQLFNIFSIPFISGNSYNALLPPNSIVITDEMAKKYFDDQDPIGKTLLYDTKTLLNVTGVVKKMPGNSDLNFDFLISFETLFAVEEPLNSNFIKNDWTFNTATTYCLFKPGQNIKSAEVQLNKLLQKYGDERKNIHSISLQPLKDIHLYAANIQGNPSTSSISYIYIFSAIAFLILLIANVNFINLATARAGTRAREVGMRKILGAGKRQLIFQFLGETVLLSTAALVFAFTLTELALPILNSLTNKQLTLSSWFNFQNIFLFSLIFLFTGMLSGLYPAFFITHFNLILAIKGKTGETSKRNITGKILLVTQFSVSIILIIGAIVIYRQLEYIRNKPLGFKKEQVLVVPIFGSGASSLGYGVDGPMRKRMNTFAGELTKFSKIKAVTAASSLPGQGSVLGLVIPENKKETDNIFVPWISVDYNFLDALEIPLIAGRTFSKSTGTDHLKAFILNESAVRSFGWKSPADAIGKNIVRGKESDGKHGQVIGVIKDYNFSTLDQPMQPQIIDVSAPRFTQFAISVQDDHTNETIAFIKQKWDELFPERVFEYSFLDSDINALYKDKENLSKIIEYFALIAILLSCSGLFSLASFLSMQRTKEIGIRKVLGASVAVILVMLSKDFIKLVFISLAISAPIGWYVMTKWLENYAYKIDISWWIFILAGAIVLLLTSFIIGFQSIKAAIINPVKSLRTE
jgi:putative ABC transport system permease protein